MEMKFGIVFLLFIGCVASKVLKGCKKPFVPNVGKLGATEVPDRGGIYSVGTTIQLKCPQTWKRTGSEFRKCKEDGSWSDNSFNCEKILAQCSDPGSPLGGTRRGKCCVEGQTLYFSCKKGFLIRGSSRMECRSNSIWSKPLPTCHRDPRRICPDPGYTDNSARVDTKRVNKTGFGPGDKVIFTCNPGYGFNQIWEFVSSHELTCQDDGKWDNSDSITCEEIICSIHELGVPDRGFISPVNRTDFRVNETVHYRCDEGYEIKGDEIATCDEYGMWAQKSWTPKCEVIKCPDPSWPENGRRIGSDFRIGETVVFVCETGYTLRGSESRTCTTRRSWNGTLTICDRGDWDCPDPGTPIGALKDGQSYNVGDTVTFSCGQDFLLQGSGTRECLANGMWSGMQTFCKYKRSFSHVEEVATIFNAKMDTVSIGTKDSFLGSQILPNITYDNETLSLGRSLNVGYQFGLDLYILLDISGSISDDELEITKNFTKALVGKVGVSDTTDGTRVAIITYDDEITVISNLFDGKRTVEVLKEQIDNIERKEEGGTAMAAALSYVKDALIPTGKIEGSKAKIALVMVSDGVHNMGGDPIPTAEKLKSSFVDMYTIGIGDDIKQEVLGKIASVGQFYHLQATTDLKTFTDKLIDESVDVYSECGVGGLINLSLNQSITDRSEAKDITHWPWMAALYHDAAGTEVRNDFAFRCGASLIDTKWVLTAAHCVIDKKERIKEKDVEIRMGSLERDDPKKTNLYVQKIIMHPRYDRDTLQNDIALLKLVSPVILTTTIRTVCLPDDIMKFSDIDGVEDLDDFYSAKRWTVVTGWGDDRKLGKDQLDVQHVDTLKQIQMRIQDNTTCIRSLGPNQAYAEEVVYCAGDGANRDACKGDSGGPSMVQLKVNEYTNRVFQVGIVSWGNGCKQANKYGFYTRLAEYVGWMRVIMEKNRV